MRDLLVLLNQQGRTRNIGVQDNSQFSANKLVCHPALQIKQ